MPVMTYSLASFTKTNVDMPAGTTFTAYATGTPIANAQVTSGKLYLSSIRTYSGAGYLTFTLGSGSGTTANFPSNSAIHAETINLSTYSNELLKAGSGTISFTLKRTSSGSGNILNLRAALTGTLTLNYNLIYTACTAPTSVTVSKTNTAPGESVVLSWSGAKAGTNNTIAGYQIYRATSAAGTYSLLASVTSTAASGTYNVTAPTANASSYYYKVLTVGNISGYHSAQSTVYASLTCQFTVPDAPTSVSLSRASAMPGTTVKLSWSGAKSGTNNAITGYQVWRAVSQAGPYSQLATVTTGATYASLDVIAPSTGGSEYYYKVVTAGSISGSNSAQSTAYAVLTALDAPPEPAPPIIQAPGEGTIIYSAQPRLLIRVDVDSPVNTQTIQAAGYTASRAGEMAPGDKVVLRRTDALTGTGNQSVAVTAVNTAGISSTQTVRGFTYTTPAYTDPTLTPLQTPIKAAHINELRSMVNTLRVYYGLMPVAWGESITAQNTSLGGWKVHVMELRSAIEAVAAHINGWDTSGDAHDVQLPVWIPVPVNKPIAAVIDQLRECITLL